MIKLEAGMLIRLNGGLLFITSVDEHPVDKGNICYTLSSGEKVRDLVPEAVYVETCMLCGHSKADNAHGIDQNDLDYDESTDSYVHSGSCTYCSVCNPVGVVNRRS